MRFKQDAAIEVDFSIFDIDHWSLRNAFKRTKDAYRAETKHGEMQIEGRSVSELDTWRFKNDSGETIFTLFDHELTYDIEKIFLIYEASDGFTPSREGVKTLVDYLQRNIAKIRLSDESDNVRIDNILANEISGTVQIKAGNGDDTVRSGSFWQGTVIHGGGGNDKLYGGKIEDDLYGGAGDDVLRSGSGGSYTLYGGKGNDLLRGNQGLDMIYGGAGDDKLYAVGFDSLSGGSGDDRLVGSQQSRLSGGLGDDFLKNAWSGSGGRGDDVLKGRSGGSELKGDRGQDSLHGGAGDDFLYGGYGRDVLAGGGGKDQLHGEQGNDVLKGGDGVDVLYGKSGNDKLTGGEGADLFSFFDFPEDGSDVVMDFEDGTDRIATSHSGRFDDVTIAVVDGETTVSIQGASMVLKDIAIAQLSEADFAF